MTSIIHNAKAATYRHAIESNTTNAKQMWAHLRDLCPRAKTPTPMIIRDGKLEITTPQEIANTFNEYFSTIANHYITDSTLGRGQHTLLKNFVNEKLDGVYTMPEITEHAVNKALLALNPGKSTGADTIRARLLKAAAPAITMPITTIINNSIRSGTFPTMLKLAKVFPIHKKGATDDKGNYRPISVLSALSKILERHVHDSLYAYLMARNLLHGSQSGFRTQHSCETALNYMVHKWALTIDKGLVNGVVLLDLRKAFDLVNHAVLLEKMAIYGCSQQLMQWFTSYLSKRQQIVQFKGKLSHQAEIQTGVPQGSILGPLLFIMFMNDMPLNVSASVDMYADDYIITATGKTTQAVEVKLNKDLHKISKWCEENKMVINAEKTKIMLITTRQKWQHLRTTDPNVHIIGENIQVVNSERLLGVQIDHFHSWSSHLQTIHTTIARYIALLCRIKKYLPYQARQTFYHSFFLPHMDYCSTLWGDSSAAGRIHMLQKRAARVLTDSPYRTPSAPLFEQLRWLSLPDRVSYMKALLVFKSVNGLAPDYMCDLFESVQTVSSRNTRANAKGDLYVPLARTQLYQNSITISGANIRNELGTAVRSCNSVKYFKGAYMRNICH